MHPARIYRSGSSSAEVEVGGHFGAKCSTFGLKEDDELVFVYLCKNGVGIERMATKSHDSIFPMTCATTEDTGNYSCVFSRTKRHPSEVVGEGESHIFIKVTGKNDHHSNIMVTINQLKNASIVQKVCNLFGLLLHYIVGYTLYTDTTIIQIHYTVHLHNALLLCIK